MKTMYKSILVATILLLSVANASAQTTGYSHKGCDVRCSVAKQDSVFFLVVTLSSNKTRFLAEPTIMLRTFDGTVMKLTGVSLGEGSVTSNGVVCPNGYVLTNSSIVSTAQFQVTPEQMEAISSGIEKIRLSTTPKEHEYTFTKDKFGAKLYKLYVQVRDKDDTF